MSKWNKIATDLLESTGISSDQITEDTNSIAKALKDAYNKGKKDALNPEKPRHNNDTVSIKSKDVVNFNDLVNKLAASTFGINWEDRCPVKVYVLDSTRYESICWWPLPKDIEDMEDHPYNHKNWDKNKHTEKENIEVERALRDNKKCRYSVISYYNDYIGRLTSDFFKSQEYQLRKEDEKLPTEIANRIKELEYIKNKWQNNPDPFSFYISKEKGKKPFFTIDKEKKTYSFLNNKGEIITFPIDEKPNEFDELMKELEKLKKWKYPEIPDWESL
jgi:hypothetical protein